MGDRSRLDAWLHRPIGIATLIGLVAVVVAVPAWLFADPLRYYRLFSDDFAYVAASRTLPRALGNLFVPHNTHIVPSWRLLTWALVAIAGRLAGLQVVLATASYLSMVLVMLATGRFVARETGRATLGLAAMAGVGTTSLMESSATWYSASQTLWASLGILASLLLLQGWRMHGGAWRLVAAGLSAWVAAGFWTVGHAAGPVGVAYLWADGRSQARKVAWVPLAATASAFAIALLLGGKQINATISFGGRTTIEATDPVRGVSHTLQAIPENLMLGNLGLVAETTIGQGAVLTIVPTALWVLIWWRRRRPNPLECAGAALVLVSSYVEWTVRGYLPFSSLRGLVPWYDTIPDVGFVLFVAGCWAGGGVPAIPGPIARPSRAGALAVLALQAALFVLHQPRVEALFQAKLPALTEDEAKAFPIPELRHLRAVYMAEQRHLWQQRCWVRLDEAEAVARREGIGREAIRQTFGRVVAPEIADVYDAADMLALPWRGTVTDPKQVRRALAAWLTPEPDPAPAGSLLKVLGIRVNGTRSNNPLPPR